MNGLGELKTLTKNLGRKLLLKQKNKNYRLDVKGEVEELKRFLKESHKNFVEELFLKEDGEVLVSVSEALGALLVGSGVSSSMIRNIFGYVKKYLFVVNFCLCCCQTRDWYAERRATHIIHSHSMTKID